MSTLIVKYDATAIAIHRMSAATKTGEYQVYLADDVDPLITLLRQREEEVGLLQHEGIQITASLHDDEIPTTEPLSVNVEDVRTLRSQLRQWEEEGGRLKKVIEKQQFSIEHLSEQHTLQANNASDLTAQLAAMTSKVKELYGHYDVVMDERDMAQQQLAASLARCAQLKEALKP